MISVMKGDREEKVALTRTVGRGSSLQVEDLDLWMSYEISFAEGKVNTESEWEGVNKTGTGEFRTEVDISWRWMC